MFSKQHHLYSSLRKIKKVFVAEDYNLLRELFKEIVKVIPSLHFAGSSADGQEALKKCLEIQPDLVILDIRLPEVNGLEILTILKRKLPDTKIIMVTGNTNLKTINMAVSSGANGFIEKSDGLDELKKGIESVINDKYYFSQSVLELDPSLKNKME